MTKKRKKEKFYVEEEETVADCLNRMAANGYQPVRRMEEPVLKEVKKNGKVDVEVSHQRIMFEGKLKEE